MIINEEILNELTPVQKFDGVFFKRDDYFKPFGEHHVNGGKLRQAIRLLQFKINELKTKYDNGIITAASVHSPQSTNMAKVSQHFGITCISVVGGTKEESLNKLPMMKLTKYYGSEIKIVAGHGMTNVIHARMKEMAQKLNYLPIEMGQLMEENPESIFSATADQVRNIPDELDNMVIPVGSAIQFTGILMGIKKFNKKVGNIYAVCVGPNREKKVENYLKKVFNTGLLDYNKFKMFPHGAPYAKFFDKFKITDGEYIDDIYEGKAFDWMNKNDLKGDTLFWCVGKRLRPEEVDYVIKNGL